MKRITLFLFALSSTLFAVSQPNIIIMLVDDMGVMDTSLPFLTDAEGKPRRYPLNEYYRTPNMERLAARGIRFNNFCAMSVCSPTRISIMTGQNAARHHTTNWINPDNDNAGPQGPPEWNWKGLSKGSVTLPSLLQAELLPHPLKVLTVKSLEVQSKELFVWWVAQRQHWWHKQPS